MAFRASFGITESLFLEQADTVLPGLRSFAEPELDPRAAAMVGPLAVASAG
jgi:hypothetical protein